MSDARASRGAKRRGDPTQSPRWAEAASGAWRSHGIRWDHHGFF